MAIEIERKFLVHSHLLPELKNGERMIQGYLSEEPSIRFRITGKMMVLTIKDYYAGGRRFELETPPKAINQVEIAKLCDLALNPPVSKVRYKIQESQGLIFEIDVYEKENKGLITVEVELPRADYPLILPAWVDAEKEITSDARYSNFNLGRFPYTRWN